MILCWGSMFHLHLWCFFRWHFGGSFVAKVMCQCLVQMRGIITLKPPFIHFFPDISHINVKWEANYPFHQVVGTQEIGFISKSWSPFHPLVMMFFIFSGHRLIGWVKGGTIPQYFKQSCIILLMIFHDIRWWPHHIPRNIHIPAVAGLIPILLVYVNHTWIDTGWLIRGCPQW